MNLKTGTRIEMLLGRGVVEKAKICRWTKSSGPRMDRRHVVQFDGHKGKFIAHEDAFRVTDTRKGYGAAA